ncbi:MAG TPA: hypothetical protein VMU50_00645 [Polyangia bacterium]|nr:hypothetical protein [Polyangia bacterium]
MRTSFAGAAVALLSVAAPLTRWEPAARAADAPPPTAAVPAADAATPSRAAADAAPVKVFPRLRPPDLEHRMQFGFALLLGSGYRTIFPYQEMVGCGQVDKRVCSGRLPLFLDVQPSFGITRRWDILVDLRFGIEQDFTPGRQFVVAPGFRYWSDADQPIKLFATVQVAFDTTADHDPALKHSNDIAFRNSNGIMFEVVRNFGVYFQAGDTIGFLRWLSFAIDLGVGVQARIP